MIILTLIFYLDIMLMLRKSKLKQIVDLNDIIWYNFKMVMLTIIKINEYFLIFVERIERSSLHVNY